MKPTPGRSIVRRIPSPAIPIIATTSPAMPATDGCFPDPNSRETNEASSMPLHFPRFGLTARSGFADSPPGQT